MSNIVGVEVCRAGCVMFDGLTSSIFTQDAKWIKLHLKMAYRNGRDLKATVHRNDKRPLLEVRDLRTHFFTQRGVVKAVDGVSFQLMPGETLGLVGESGSGKTMTCLSILRLLPRGAEIVDGQIFFDGEDITNSSERDMERLRGKRVGMILRNSMAALDPVFTIGTQIGEPLVVH